MDQNKPNVASLIQKKRFNNEKKLLDNSPLGYITAYPKDDNPLIWYILVVGQKGSHYEGGHFIGEIHHSPKYPAEPPDYIMRTPNGRYEIDKKICLSNSGYHKGEWSSTWNIHTILIAFYSIWLDDKEHGISHITRSKEERLKFANESIDFNMKKYKDIYTKFNFDSLSFDVDHDPKYNKKSEPIEPTKPIEPTEPTEPINPAEQKIKLDEIVEKTNNYVDNVDNIEVIGDKKINILEPVSSEDVQPLKKNKNIVIEDDTKNIVIEDKINKNIKQNLNFQEIFHNIDTINQSINEQQKSINNLTNKLSKSL